MGRKEEGEEKEATGCGQEERMRAETGMGRGWPDLCMQQASRVWCRQG